MSYPRWSLRGTFSRLGLRASLLAAAAVVSGACGGATTRISEPIVKIDGSSTVYAITEAVAEEFQNKNQNVRITVDISSTEGGLQRFCRGDTDISDASRPILATELAQCASAGVTFVELPVAHEGLVVAVNPKNTWTDHMTVAELKALWAPEAEGTITRWSQVRPGWPDREIHLVGAGTSSDAFRFFTGAILGTEGSSRHDYSSDEDENASVQRVTNDELGLGFFGYERFYQNKEKLKLVPIDDGKDDNGKGPVLPSPESVRNDTYQPLSHALFIYVSRKAMERPEVKSFVEYYLKEGPWLIDQLGSIQLGDKGYELVRQRLAKGIVGSMFASGDPQGLTLEQRLAQTP